MTVDLSPAYLPTSWPNRQRSRPVRERASTITPRGAAHAKRRNDRVVARLGPRLEVSPLARRNNLQIADLILQWVGERVSKPGGAEK
jgi:hypothetical protein